LESFNQQKKRKLTEEPQQLHEFLTDLDDFWFRTQRSMCSTMDSVHKSWSDNSFLEWWSVEILQSAKKAKINRRTSTPWVLDRFG